MHLSDKFYRTPLKSFCRGESCSLDPITNFESCLYKVSRSFKQAEKKIVLRKTRRTKILAYESATEHTTVDSRIKVGPTFIKFGFFQALLPYQKVLCLLNLALKISNARLPK